MAKNNFYYKDIKKIARVCDAKLIQNNSEKEIKGFSIDSRQIKKDFLFIAIKGESLDGHNFIDAAAANGACAVIAEKQHIDQIKFPKDINIIAVEDSVKALGLLAKNQRQELKTKIIGVTGSVGKTSTRELVKSILSEKYCVLSPIKNFNNHIGVPLTLLNLTAEHDFAVIEMGMSNKGEIAYLSDIVAPDISIISKVAPAHISAFENIEGIAQEKASISYGMKKNAAIIINFKDQILKKYLPENKILSFGQNQEADLEIKNIEFKNNYSTADFCFSNNTCSQNFSIKLNHMGITNIENSAGAALACLELGIEIPNILAGLLKYNGIQGRFYKIHNKDMDFYMIDDTYNANPESVKASIRDFQILKGDENGFIVLGDMLELGSFSEKYHLEIGREAALSHPKGIFAYGEFSKYIIQGASEVQNENIILFNGTHEEISKKIIESVCPKDFVLIKGSRGSQMEKVLNNLANARSSL